MRLPIFILLSSALVLQWSSPVLAVGGLKIAGEVSSSPDSVGIQQVSTTNDPLLGSQTYLSRINIAGAWSRTTGSNLPVAVIDTGIDLNQPDLGRLWVNTDEIASNGIDDDKNGYIDDYHGYNFIQRDSNLQDAHGHGTGISGIIAAATNNSIGTAGISWGASIMVLKALNAAGSGDFDTVNEAIRYATDNGAKIINMSFGAVNEISTLKSAVDYAISRKVTIVAAVGNNYGGSVFYPAAYPDVIAVSSVDSNNQLSSFSNYGVGVDIAAPGKDVFVPAITKAGLASYVYSSGSSFAAAEVSGVVALMLSLYPNLSPAQVASILSLTASPLPDDTNRIKFGAGLLNAAQAINYQSQILSGNHYLVNNSAIANGSASVIVNATITDQFNQPQANLPISLRPAGANLLSRGTLLRDGTATLVGTTDSAGRISIPIESTLAGVKQIKLLSGANDINLSTGNVTLTFKAQTRPRYSLQWLQQSPSVIMNVGDTATLWVDLKNTGTTTWVSDPQSGSSRGNFRLGTARPLDRSTSFYDSQTWPATNRSAYFTPNVVPVGETGRFTFTIRANQSGKFREYFRPVIDQVSWLADLGIYWDINVNDQNISGFGIFNSLASTTLAEYNGDIRGKTNGLTLAPGQKAGLWVDLINTGSAAWMNNGRDLLGTGAVRLGTVSPRDRTSRFYASTWMSPNRVTGTGVMVPPHASLELMFEIQAPLTPGTYQENFQLVSEYVGWFGPVFGWTIKVS